MLQIATWNVNSIKAHLDAVLQWLKDAQPDVVCLQELKCEESSYPSKDLEELGYASQVLGQKTYNGVAILTKHRFGEVIKGLPGGEADEQARYIQAEILHGEEVTTVASIYLPNGNPAPGPKYDYKLAWMQRLRDHVGRYLQTESRLVFAGDYNIIPTSHDARNIAGFMDDALFLSPSRAAFRALTNLGLTEAYRAIHPLPDGGYSYWDYQAGAWQKNNGIRIDHLLLSPQAADCLIDVRIDKDVRGREKPSDHVPVVMTLN